MLLAGPDGNYSAASPEKAMLGILRGVGGDFPLAAILKKLLSRLSGILGLRPPAIVFIHFGSWASCQMVGRPADCCLGVWAVVGLRLAAPSLVSSRHVSSRPISIWIMLNPLDAWWLRG